MSNASGQSTKGQQLLTPLAAGVGLPGQQGRTQNPEAMGVPAERWEVAWITRARAGRSC